MPQRAAHHAGRMFVTPYASSRARAQAAQPDEAMQRGEIMLGNVCIRTYSWGDPSREPYVLLAHGWSSFGLRFLPWIEHLRAAGMAVVAFDQPAHGQSSGYYCTLPKFAMVTNAVGQHFGTAELAIGHSLGAAALVLAQDEAWHARKVVLIAPTEDMVAASDRFFQQAHLGPKLKAPFHAWHASYTGVPLTDLQLHRYLGALGQPSLIVHDLHDEDVPWAEGERYARHWQSSRLLTTEGLGHHDVVTAPAVIDAALAHLQGAAVGERMVSSPNLWAAF